MVFNLDHQVTLPRIARRIASHRLQQSHLIIKPLVHTSWNCPNRKVQLATTSLGFCLVHNSRYFSSDSFKTNKQTMKNPPHPTSSFRSVIFTANAQPLHVLIAALKTMISGRMPGEVSLCGYCTDSSMYCPCTEFSYTPKQSHNRNMFRKLGPVFLGTISF